MPVIASNLSLVLLTIIILMWVMVFRSYEREMRAVGATLGTFLLLLALVPVGGHAIYGHHQTGSGEVTGVVMEVRTNGLIWVTTSVVVKTNDAASTTVELCAEDAGVIAKLKEMQRSGRRVTLSYDVHLYWSKGCTFDSDKTVRLVEVTP